ncbi:MAG: FAD-dependent monooxygenase, partial [Planctomycetes bacterium]|nr:FAD-dependent monooxygenase [Planctomycetota bacterium]
MEPRMGVIHIIGAGGIGCAIAYALEMVGFPVMIVERSAEKIEAGRRDGLRVDQLPPLPVEFISFSVWNPASDATIILCTKCYD